MASGEQLKALLKSHAEGDDDGFFSVAMQVAAHEARRGHGRLAEELRTLIDPPHPPLLCTPEQLVVAEDDDET